MSAEVTFAIPGELDTPTGGYAYDREVITSLRERGYRLTHLRLGDSFPHPTPEHTAEAAHALSEVPAHSPLLVDGLALGALDPAAVARVSAPLIALIHHPLAFEGQLEASRRDELLRIERENLAHCAHVIVTSGSTSELLQSHYGVDSSRITVARPGTNQPTLPASPVNPALIVSVGSLIPRKGHDVLIAALASIAELPWHAVIAGSTRDDSYAASLQALIDQYALAGRIELIGSVPADQLDQLYSHASVFALATRFEGYGMVFDEAMAHGLPIVSCDTGAVGDTVAAGAGLLVDVDDPPALADALSRVLTDSDLRHTMAAASRAAGACLPSWADTATIVAGVIDGAAEGTIEA